jgi:hypothetical protein
MKTKAPASKTANAMKTRKLVLQRESLRKLTGARLREVAGGGSIIVTGCNTACTCRGWITCNTCLGCY